MQQIKAIIFDLDGLMVDSEPLARQSWVMTLNDLGFELDDTTFERMVGLRRQESVVLVKQALNLQMSSEKLLSLKETYRKKIMADGVPTMPGLIQLVGGLKQRRLPWGVATSSPKSYAQEILDRIELAVDCQAIAGGDEVDRGKPAPDVYLLAAERLGQRPEDCLALEDSVPGAKASKAAGMLTAVVPNGHTIAKDFDFVDYVFDSLESVTQNLDKVINRNK